MEALKHLRNIGAGRAALMPEFRNQLKDMIEALGKNLSDLRSGVVKEAAVTIAVVRCRPLLLHLSPPLPSFLCLWLFLSPLSQLFASFASLASLPSLAPLAYPPVSATSLAAFSSCVSFVARMVLSLLLLAPTLNSLLPFFLLVFLTSRLFRLSRLNLYSPDRLLALSPLFPLASLTSLGSTSLCHHLTATVWYY